MHSWAAWQLRMSRLCGLGGDDWGHGERQRQWSGSLDFHSLLDQADGVPAVTGLDVGTQLVVIQLGGYRDTCREYGHEQPS
jgi:hypothetical protein